VICHSK